MVPLEKTPLVELLIVVVSIAFCGFVLSLVMGVLSLLSGWAGLARRFRASAPPPPNRRRMLSGHVGWIEYRRMISVGHTDEGLYLAIDFVGVFHPPLFIPWSEVQSRGEASGFLWIADQVEVRDGPVIKLRRPFFGGGESLLPPLAD